LDPPKITTVFATMNRKEVAVTCLRRLLGQTRPLDGVVIADNVSNDGTPGVLREEAARGEVPVEVIEMPENLGNAGGVEAAMERAFADGADAVWILDDDSWPEPDALEAMLGPGWRDDVVRHCLQLKPATREFTWPMYLVAGAGGWKICDSLDDLPDGEILPSRASWTGALLPRRVREAVGPVETGLFIRGEDEDYPRRIASAGFSFEAVRGARLEHPGPEQFVRWSFLGRQLYIEPGLAETKLYYKVRNMVWIKRRESGLPGALAMAAAYAVGLARVDKMSRLRWQVFRLALTDALKGQLGKLDEGRLRRP
jgi:rhamnopyranosyl-N-acetylglucosaminyl-diphospho-decaprenol beta-1,3/1,4-galactofuranosyltransferase